MSSLECPVRCLSLGLRLLLRGRRVIVVVVAIFPSVRVGHRRNSARLGIVRSVATAVAQAARNIGSIAVVAFAHARPTLEIRVTSATRILLPTVVLTIPACLSSTGRKVMWRREVLRLVTIAMTVLRLGVHATLGTVSLFALSNTTTGEASMRSTASSPAMFRLLLDRILGGTVCWRRSPINWLHPVVELLRGAEFPLANNSPDSNGTTNARRDDNKGDDRVLGDFRGFLLGRLGRGRSRGCSLLRAVNVIYADRLAASGCCCCGGSSEVQAGSWRSRLLAGLGSLGG